MVKVDMWLVTDDTRPNTGDTCIEVATDAWIITDGVYTWVRTEMFHIYGSSLRGHAMGGHCRWLNMIHRGQIQGFSKQRSRTCDV